MYVRFHPFAHAQTANHAMHRPVPGAAFQKKEVNHRLDRLMELLNDGRAWSVADLANSLREPQKEVQRRVESLESNGYLRKACGCGPQCKGCGHCGTHSPHAPAFIRAHPSQETP